jgi:hypothetical protein
MLTDDADRRILGRVVSWLAAGLAELGSTPKESRGREAAAPPASLKATPRTLSAFESFLNFFSRIQSSKLVGRKCELRGQVEG